MTDRTAHEPAMQSAKGRRGAISAVWLVPIIALLIALAIAWQAYANRGVLIAVAFPDASGVTAGETTLRFREVTVGVVEEVGFSSDLASVNVYIRVNRDIAPFLDEDAAFWVVQPQVSARGVEGLNTILSGTYIEGTWDNEIGESATVFRGIENPPIVPPGVDGTAIVLRAADGARLEAGAPILYRGIEVGEVATPSLSTDGSEVRLDAFIRAPYDRQLSTATRFWDASGISVGIGGSGVELNVGSLAAILEGGIVFDTLISGGQEIGPGDVFDIFEDRDEALAATFEAPTSRAVRFSALFPAAASGLTDGAPVRYQGVRVGVVTSITGFVREDDPDAGVQLLSVLALQPSRMGLAEMESDLDGVDYVAELVDRGLRAQLVSTSLFGGDLSVELVNVEGETPARLEVGVADNPLIPSIASEQSSLTATAEGVMTRINDLPIEELLASATDLLDNVNRIASDADTRAIPGAALATIEGGEGLVRDMRSIVSSPETASVLLDVQTIAGDVAAVTALIREREVTERLADTLDAATAAAANLSAGTEELDELADRAMVMFDEAGRLISSEDAQALPGAARAALEAGTTALDAGTAVLAAPQVAEILEATATITADIRSLAARVATDAVATQIEAALGSIDTAARNVALGTADLSSLRDALDATVEGARGLVASEDTQALPGAARGLVADARAVIAAPEIQQLLTDLPAITDDIRTITAELREAQAAAALTEALDAARKAALSVAEGTAAIPGLSASASRVMAEAEVLAGNLTQLSAKANALALDELVSSTTDLMQTADMFLSSDEAGDVPVVLSETLQELRRTIETIRTGGTLDNLNATLTSAAGAAEGVRVAASDLPALVNRLQALSVAATGVLSAYDSDSRIAQELFATLRAATRAADDVSSLSRTIERNPNSLLLGR